MLVALDGPQDAHSTPGSGHASDTIRLGAFEFVIVTVQDGLVEQQG